MESSHLMQRFSVTIKTKDSLATFYRIWLTAQYPKEFEVYKKSLSAGAHWTTILGPELLHHVPIDRMLDRNFVAYQASCSPESSPLVLPKREYALELLKDDFNKAGWLDLSQIVYDNFDQIREQMKLFVLD